MNEQNEMKFEIIFSFRWLDVIKGSFFKYLWLMRDPDNFKIIIIPF
jgi:hypothetical protein